MITGAESKTIFSTGSLQSMTHLVWGEGGDEGRKVFFLKSADAFLLVVMVTVVVDG